jgi:hypothetical protein
MAAETLMEQIQHRAYGIWLSEGCPPGRERIHWVRAEAEFRERFAARSIASRNTGLHHIPARDHLGLRRGAQGKPRVTF